MDADRMQTGPASSRREELLELAADHVVAHGLDQASIRDLAAALGVAHNSLTHHFGARSALLAAIFERIADRSRTAALDSVRAADAPTAVRSTWDSLAHPGQRQMWTTFFEVYAAALRSPDEHGGFLKHVSRDWVEPLTALMVAEGTDPVLAAARATFVVATVRGLILDRMAGGDEARIDGALTLLIEQVAAVR